jgi:hypothetical protein
MTILIPKACEGIFERLPFQGLSAVGPSQFIQLLTCCLNETWVTVAKIAGRVPADHIDVLVPFHIPYEFSLAARKHQAV